MAVRVVRLMEYIYPDLKTAHKDMSRWAVQGTFYPGGSERNDRSITSTVIINPTDFEIVQIKEVDNDDPKPS